MISTELNVEQGVVDQALMTEEVESNLMYRTWKVRRSSPKNLRRMWIGKDLDGKRCPLQNSKMSFVKWGRLLIP